MNNVFSKLFSENNFLILWTLVLTFIFIELGIFSATTANQYRENAFMRRTARIDPKLTEAGMLPHETKLPPGANPRKVTTGIYIDGISSVSIIESNWGVSFYIWFKWNSDDINPGETFKIVDGEITEKKKFKESTINGEHYAMYFVRATITKFFNTLRFPIDDHLMTLGIEDESLVWNELEYVPDTKNSNIGARIKIPGYVVNGSGLVMKPHTYKTNFGDSKVQTVHSTYSQLICWVWNARPGLGPYFKVFIGLFAAVAISLLSFFIKPANLDPRFGLGVGAFFGAIANMLLSASLVPESATLTLMDLINGIGIIVIFLSLVESTISLYIYETLGRVHLSRTLDYISFLIFAIGYTITNILIPLLGITQSS
jgi:hypothetical protein